MVVVSPDDSVTTKKVCYIKLIRLYDLPKRKVCIPQLGTRKSGASGSFHIQFFEGCPQTERAFGGRWEGASSKQRVKLAEGYPR